MSANKLNNSTGPEYDSPEAEKNWATGDRVLFAVITGIAVLGLGVVYAKETGLSAVAQGVVNVARTVGEFVGNIVG